MLIIDIVINGNTASLQYRGLKKCVMMDKENYQVIDFSKSYGKCKSKNKEYITFKLPKNYVFPEYAIAVEYEDSNNPNQKPYQNNKDWIWERPYDVSEDGRKIKYKYMNIDNEWFNLKIFPQGYNSENQAIYLDPKIRNGQDNNFDKEVGFLDLAAALIFFAAAALGALFGVYIGFSRLSRK